MSHKNPLDFCGILTIKSKVAVNMLNSASTLGLYIHVPFCIKKCPYCSFYSVAAHPEFMDVYTNKICENIEEFAKKINKKADTLYFGGGTPSLLGTHRILKILAAARKHFGLNNAEITIEVNPATEQALNFKELHSNGVNRLSIGLQSAHENELKLLGRLHSAETAKGTVITAQNAGFSNISLDLIVAIQKQTKESLAESIEFCAQLGVQHVSAYMLSIEPGTSYYRNREQLQLKTEDEQSELYLQACRALEAFGFAQYEISNFCKKGYESRHNLKYWNAEEYLGLGPSAHSFVNGQRFYFENSLEKFLNGTSPHLDGIGGTEEEYALLRLRLSEGLTNERYLRRFKKNIPQIYFENAKHYESHGLLEVKRGESIRLLPKGFLVSNELISKIILE